MIRRRSFSRRGFVLGSLGAAGSSLISVSDAAAVPVAVRQDAGYTIENLGGSGRASAINGSGQIAGLSGSTAALWDQGERIDLGAWPGDSSSEAFAINDGGVIVGASWSSSYQSHAVLWSQGQIFDLGTLSGGTDSMALAINIRNQVVGWSAAADGTTHAVRWDLETGQIFDLGTVFDGGYAEATGINDDDTVVGWAESSDGTPYAFRDAQQLGDGSVPSIALGINSEGQVVGTAQANDGNDHAVQWDAAGDIVDLGTDGSYSWAGAINNDGLVVGGRVLGGPEVAVLWDRGQVLELERLAATDSTAAYGVNGSRLIVGESDGEPVRWQP